MIIAQSQSALTAIVDWKLCGIQLDRFKFCCIAANIIGNLIAIGSAGITSGSGTVFWCFIFMINALAAGLANLYSEVYLKTMLGTESSLYDNFVMVIAVNMLSNLCGIPITFLGLPLARYSVGEDIQLYDFAIFSDPRIWYWIGMLLSSYVYTICAYLLLHSESSIFNAMCAGFGASIQLCIFMIPSMPYSEVPPTIVIISAIVVITSSFLYASRSEERDEMKMKTSFFGQAARTGSLDGALGVMYTIAFVVYLTVDTLLPLLPELPSCVDLLSIG